MDKVINSLIFWGIKNSILEMIDIEMDSEGWTLFSVVVSSLIVTFSGRRLPGEEA